jgi:Recombination endonuclease VII
MKKKVVKNKHYRLRKLFGLTPEGWDELFELQNRQCGICESRTTAGKDWHTDHDHATNKLRSILCYHCNLLLGMAKDSTDTLGKAIKYLERHSDGK